MNNKLSRVELSVSNLYKENEKIKLAYVPIRIGGPRAAEAGDSTSALTAIWK